MATYAATGSETAICGRTLVASTEDTVTLLGNERAVEVRYWPGTGTDAIYFRVNSGSSAATLPGGSGGTPCKELLPGDALQIDAPGSVTQVRLISAGVAKYSVTEA